MKIYSKNRIVESYTAYNQCLLRGDNRHIPDRADKPHYISNMGYKEWCEAGRRMKVYSPYSNRTY